MQNYISIWHVNWLTKLELFQIRQNFEKVYCIVCQQTQSKKMSKV